MDSILYVIDPTLGNQTFFDDDNGPQALSKIIAGLYPSRRWVVAGNYWYDGGGPIRVGVMSDNPDSDSDHDGLSNSLESLINESSSTDADSDDDGLTDLFELHGSYFEPNTGLPGNTDLAWMPVWEEAHPSLQDLFIEMDFMAGGGHTHVPYANIVNEVAFIFTGDSAFNGRNIRTHAEIGQILPDSAGIGFENCPNMSGLVNFYTLKNNASFFNPNKWPARYVVFGHARYRTSDCAIIGSSGVAELLGNDAIVTLPLGASQAAQIGTLMHEVGHNLYLDHNNNDDPVGVNPPPQNYGCVHSSVLNYRWQQFGVGNTNPAAPLRAFGYSRGQCVSAGSNAPQAGVANCSTVVNNCVGGCVPSGQPTTKRTCPAGPTPGTFVSNGTCDCDRDEWLAPPPNTPQANRVTLMGVGQVLLDGGPSSEDLPALLGTGRRSDPRVARRLSQKLDILRAGGLREGHDFIVGDNGKTYTNV
jgi:hypothetical protein